MICFWRHVRLRHTISSSIMKWHDEIARAAGWLPEGFGFYYRNDVIVTAEQFFRAAHDFDPKFILPLTWLGNIAYQRAKFHEGIDYFERALRLEKKLPEAYLGLGYCYEQLHDLPKALRYFEQYVQLVPHSVEAAEIRNRIAELSKDSASGS
jgi:tetratricopeptide (TPR) repeat protein